MYILGINGSPNMIHENRFGVGESSFHDAGAAILRDGELVMAIEEERLNRIKHTNKWPRKAINACLQSCSIPAGMVDHFVFNGSEKQLDAALSRAFEGQENPSPGALPFLKNLLEDQFQTQISPDKIALFDHHYAHAATAFYPSGFSDSLVLTIDGSGGEYSGSVYNGSGNDLSLLQAFSEEQSLGHFYHYVTHLLGFGSFDEYKVMGLAPYGNPQTYRKVFREFFVLLPNGNYELCRYKVEKLREIIPPKDKDGRFSQVHMDVAASLQETLERIVFHIVKHYRKETRHTRLCMAGGVALNCTLNGKLINSGIFEDVFVYPGANDSGLSVGVALAAYFKKCRRPRRLPLKDLYLGKEIGNTGDVEKELANWASFIHYERVADPSKKAAELLADDKVIGWVQGRSEFAPRALGNRSILADPRPSRNKERINSIVKKREGFRPFAPSVMEEYATEYFQLPANRTEFSHMMFVLKVRKRYRQHLGAVTHVDGTARVQTVSAKRNRRYWQLIDHFRGITGTPVVLNTSFNNNAEPIVDSVRDAIVCFLTTNLDNLVVNDFLVTRNGFSMNAIERMYPSIPSFMQMRRIETFGWVADINFSKTHELINTFNNKVSRISDTISDMLLQANGKETVGDILEKQRISDASEKAALLREISGLWDKRIIVLSPTPLQ